MTHYPDDPPTKHQPWTPEQDVALVMAKANNRTSEQIALDLQKARPGVTAKSAAMRWKRIKDGLPAPRIDHHGVVVERWREAEDKILVEGSDVYGLEWRKAQELLAIEGFHRSKYAIVAHLVRLRNKGLIPKSRQRPKPKKPKSKRKVKARHVSLGADVIRIVFISDKGAKTIIVDRKTARQMMKIGMDV